MKPFLTDTEILEICEPLTQPAAQVRHLEGLGLIVKRKPNGNPQVASSSLARGAKQINNLRKLSTADVKDEPALIFDAAKMRPEKPRPGRSLPGNHKYGPCR